MQYFVQCDRWLSSREGDGRTFKDFEVTDRMTYNPGRCSIGSVKLLLRQSL